MTNKIAPLLRRTFGTVLRSQSASLAVKTAQLYQVKKRQLFIWQNPETQLQSYQISVGGLTQKTTRVDRIPQKKMDLDPLTQMETALDAAKQRAGNFSERFNLFKIKSSAGLNGSEPVTPREKLDYLRETLDAIPEQNKVAEIRQLQAAVVKTNVNQNEKVNQDNVGDVYNRFFALMERLIQQEDKAAQEIYLRTKKRTDDVDLLTKLLGRINNAPKGTVDWSKDAEIQEMLKAAKEMGVQIPDGLKFTEEQRIALGKNIDMRRSDMEKMTQMERTDFQARMQNSSIWHQTRSNVLKYLERTASTITGNMRPH